MRGCDPKKVLVGAAETIERSLLMKGKGISGEAKMDWPRLIRYKRTFIAGVPEGREKGFSEAGIDMYHGAVRFMGKGTLAVGGDPSSGQVCRNCNGRKTKGIGYIRRRANDNKRPFSGDR